MLSLSNLKRSKTKMVYNDMPWFDAMSVQYVWSYMEFAPA